MSGWSSPTNRRAVPDTDGEVARHLSLLEEVLLQLQPYEPDDEPAPLGLGAVALEAVQRISAAVRAAESAPTPPQYASGGTFELVPLRFVVVDDRDLAAAGEAIAALGLALLPGGDELAAEVLGEFADVPARGDRQVRYGIYGARQRQPSDLVADFARSHALVDLTPDEDTALLADVLAPCPRLCVCDFPDGDPHLSTDHVADRIVLTVDQERAYRRLTERHLAVFHQGDPFARFLYEGTRVDG